MSFLFFSSGFAVGCMKRIILTFKKKVAFVIVYRLSITLQGTSPSFVIVWNPCSHLPLGSTFSCKFQCFSNYHFVVRILKASSLLFSLLFDIHSLKSITSTWVCSFHLLRPVIRIRNSFCQSVSCLPSSLFFRRILCFFGWSDPLSPAVSFFSSVMSVLQTASLIVLSCMRYDAPSAMTLTMKIVFESWWWWFEEERSLLPKNKRHKEETKGKTGYSIILLSDWWCWWLK